MAKKSKPRLWIEYLIAKSIVGSFAVLPRKAAMRFGVLMGRASYFLLGHLRRVGLRNLELAFPESTLRERERILRGSFGNMGRVLGVVSQFTRMDASEVGELIEYTPDPAFDAAYQQTKTDGRGRIILGGHMGNWELGAFAYPTFFEPFDFIARKADNPLIEQMIFDIRTRLGNRQMDKTNVAGSMIRLLRNGGNVGVLADVNSHPKEGVFVPFFGIQACTASGVAMLATRANAAIVPTFAYWNEEKKKYSYHHEDIIEPIRSGDRKRDIRETTALYSAALERSIRKFPDQWIWIHKRWKTRPPGEEELY